MDETIKLLLKFVGLVVSYIAFSWLIPQCDTIADESFNAWLVATIFSFISAVFFIAWITETLVNWKNK